MVWRAFELRPDPVPTLDPAGDYLRNGWSRSVYPMAAAMGITIRLPPVQPRSRLAHQAAHWARKQGEFDACNAAIFRAFFERGEDIGDIAVLVALAARAGLDGDALRAALEGGDDERAVLEDEALAQSFGLGGVPAFVADRAIVATGVQPVASLRRLVAAARGRKGPGPGD